MTYIQNQVISHVTGAIYGITAYESIIDNTHHVVVATTDGTLYELHWNRTTSPTPPQRIAQFNGIASLGGFFTSDDDENHVIVATEEGTLHEVYFKTPQQVQLRSPLYRFNTGVSTGFGMAAFSAIDGELRYVTVGCADSILREVAWNAAVTPAAQNLATQFNFKNVAAIAGFIDLNAHSCDVIVAYQGGSIFDVHHGSAIPQGGPITTDTVTTFSPPLVNVASFLSYDTGYRHVITLNASGQLYDYSYTSQQALGQTLLASLANVVDIAAYYSDWDYTRHVIAATSDGNIHEIYYGPLAG